MPISLDAMYGRLPDGRSRDAVQKQERNRMHDLQQKQSAGRLSDKEKAELNQLRQKYDASNLAFESFMQGKGLGALDGLKGSASIFDVKHKEEE